MSTRVCQFQLVLVAGYLFGAAFAGSGARDFLKRRPGLSKDDQLWKAFLKSEDQQGHLDQASKAQLEQDSVDELQLEPSSMMARNGKAFVDTSHQDQVKSRDSRLQAALHSCLKDHFSSHLNSTMPLPIPVPGGSMAAVAAAAAASLNLGSKHRENIVKARLETCLDGTQKNKVSAQPAAPIIAPQSMPKAWTAWGARTKNATALVQADVASPCSKSLKTCKKDNKNCRHVLDILQFLRLEHIAVEKVIQREADAAKNHALLLQTVLEKHGLTLPKAEDWTWTDSKHNLLQSALEGHGLALLNQDWKSAPTTSTTPLNHPIPVVPEPLSHPIPVVPSIPTHYHAKLPLEHHAMPIKLQHLRAECPPERQKKLDDCRSSLKECNLDVDDHNSILNSISDRASLEREVKLQGLHPYDYRM
jgi:hypothetical protein